VTKAAVGVRVYTVVDVMRGVAVGARSFRRVEDARAHMQRLLHGRSLDEDDVRILKIPSTSRLGHTGKVVSTR